MLPGFDRHLQLGADAVGGGDQQRVAHAGRPEIEDGAEAAELGVGAGAPRRAGERLDGVDEGVAGVDVDAGLPVAVAAAVADNGALVRNWRPVGPAGNILDSDLFSMAEPGLVKVRMQARLALFLLLLVAVFAAPAAAQTPSAFAVRNVDVDQTAATAAEAREAALAEGQRKAFQRLLERLALRSHHSRLPRASAQQIADLVENFEVQNERASAVRYIATYTFRFNPDGVRALLQRADVPFAETYSRPLVVLPVYHDGDVAVLWDEPNPWLAAWRNLPPTDGLQPLIVPLGDLGDIGAISADQAQRGDSARVAAIAAKYGAGGAVLAEAVLDRSRSGQQVAQVATTRFDGIGTDQTMVESYAAGENEDPAALLARAVVQTARAIEEQWKTDVALRVGSEASLVADVSFNAIADWVAIRDRLTSSALVRKAEVLSLSRSRARVELRYAGSESALRLALAQRDLLLNQEGAGWSLSLRRAGDQTGALSRP
jgi:hypothetical protein